MTDEKTIGEIVVDTDAAEKVRQELKALIRDEIGMFMHEGPGWWNNHNPLEYHKCGRCGIILPMGSGCLCASMGNTKIITTELA